MFSLLAAMLCYHEVYAGFKLIPRVYSAFKIWMRRSTPSPYLISGEDPGNEDDFTNEQIEVTVMLKQVAMAMTKVVEDIIYLAFEVNYTVKVFVFDIFFSN